MSTFKTRVARFWSWYSKNAAKLYRKVDQGKSGELVETISGACNKCLPGFAWCFGPGANEQGHSFTITGEGKPGFYLLAEYWLAQAPQLEGWTFYSSRQASKVSGEEVIGINEMEFCPKDFLVKPIVFEERELIGIDFWHPEFPNCDEHLRFTVLGLWLDECLGEVDATAWIGSAEAKDLSGDSAAFPILKLRSYLDLLQKEKGWEKLPPGDTYTLYEIPEPSDAFPRADTISGTTCNMPLISDFLSSEGRMEDPLEGTGAQFLYIGINREYFPAGEEVDFRANLEEAIDTRLRAEFSGRVFGGAFGLKSGYIDLVIYDGKRSIELIKEVLSQQGIEGDYFIRPFANPKG